MTATSSWTEILRGFIEQEETGFHMYVADEMNSQWHTRCDNATTREEAIEELGDMARSWGYRHVEIWDPDQVTVTVHQVPATDERMRRIAQRRAAGSAALKAHHSNTVEGARKWCPECRRWVPAPHTCPDFFAATPELSVIK
jgi:hypothetical protein